MNANIIMGILCKIGVTTFITNWNEVSESEKRVITFGYKLLVVKCYQCAYSPGKTTYKEIHEPVSVRNPHNPYEKKVEYRVKKVG